MLLLYYFVTVLAVANNVLAKPSVNIEEYIKVEEHGLSTTGKEDDMEKPINELIDKHERQITMLDPSIHLPNNFSFTKEDNFVEVQLQLGNKKKEARYTRQTYQAPIGQGPYLFFANRIYLVQLQNVPELNIYAFSGPLNAIAVDFDKREHYIFWSDVVTSAIYRAREDGTELTVLVFTNITTPDGIAWDWINEKLYWTDAGDYDLEVYDPSTNYREVLIQNGNTSRPRAIIVDPCTGYMYWSDWGQPATIERAMLDGSNRIILHNTNLVWPNAMTMDYETQTLYWMDVRRLESSNADGSNRMLLSTLHIYHPFSMVFYNNSLFWSDWLVKEVRSAEISQLNTVYIVMTNLTHVPMGITVVTTERQKICEVNECTTKMDNCHSNATCTNTPGSFTCTCNPGYSGNGVTCVDIDECDKNTDNCDSNANCTNTPGSFICTCNQGYSGDGVTCKDRDECYENTDDCHSNATCTNTLGSFTCTCNPGYSGNGVTCEDIDECTVNIDNCDSNANCTNTPGSFTCTCNRGYSGNGVTCKGMQIGFEEEYYFVDNDACSIQLCVKIYQPANIVDQLYVMNFMLYPGSDNSTNGSNFELITLTPSVQLHHITIDINNFDPVPDSLTAVISNYSGILPPFVILSPRTAVIDRRRPDIVIGFEKNILRVYENDNHVEVCVKITNPSDIPTDQDYLINLLTVSDKGKILMNSSITLNKLVTRQCEYIVIVHDNIRERAKEFTAVISNDDLPSYVRLNPDEIYITVLNSKRELTIGFDAPVKKMKVLETSGKVEICISASENINGIITMEVVIPSFSARDLNISSSLILFDGSHSRNCIDLIIINDAEPEGNENVVLNLVPVFMTKPFCLTVEPSFLTLQIEDDDVVTVGFEVNVVEVTKLGGRLTSVEVCAVATITGDDVVRLIMETVMSGLANEKDFFPIREIITLSRNQSRDCGRITINRTNTDDLPVETFAVTLSQLEKDVVVVLEPETALVKIFNKKTAPDDQCNPDTLNWTNWVTNTHSREMPTSKYICNSKKAVNKTREKISEGEVICIEEGQFCTTSQEERIIRSFRLGINTYSSIPQVSSHNNSRMTQRREQLACETSDNEVRGDGEKCIPARPQVCGNRSILFVLDTSHSVGPKKFNILTSAVGELTKYLCGNVRVAVAKFNQHTFSEFCFDSITTRYNLSSYIASDITYEENGEDSKNISGAIRCISEHIFHEDCGDHSKSDCIDIVYITTGQSNDKYSGCREETSLKQSLPLRDSICNKTRVYAIGIGTDVDINELRCIADVEMKDNQDTVFQYDSFIDFKKTVSMSVQYVYEKEIYCGNGVEEYNNRIDIS